SRSRTRTPSETVLGTEGRRTPVTLLAPRSGIRGKVVAAVVLRKGIVERVGVLEVATEFVVVHADHEVERDLTATGGCGPAPGPGHLYDVAVRDEFRVIGRRGRWRVGWRVSVVGDLRRSASRGRNDCDLARTGRRVGQR